MTMKDLKQKMTTSISEVLETMFYMALEFEECDNIQDSNIDNEGDIRICRLDFTGSLTGHFIIFVPKDLLITMASDFMGEDKTDITQEYSDGTIKEIINMVGGNMFAVLDHEAEFNLGIPEIVEDSDFIRSISSNPPEGLVIAEAIEGHLGFIIYAG